MKYPHRVKCRQPICTYINIPHQNLPLMSLCIGIHSNKSLCIVKEFPTRWKFPEGEFKSLRGKMDNRLVDSMYHQHWSECHCSIWSIDVKFWDRSVQSVFQCTTCCVTFTLISCNASFAFLIIVIIIIIMATLCNRAGHYIFARWFLSSFFLSFFFIPRLISAVEDWMSAILPHMVWP